MLDETGRLPPTPVLPITPASLALAASSHAAPVPGPHGAATVLAAQDLTSAPQFFRINSIGGREQDKSPTEAAKGMLASSICLLAPSFDQLMSAHPFRTNATTA